MPSKRPRAIPPPPPLRDDRASTIRVGTHYLLELHDCPHSVLNDPGAVERALKESAREGRLTVVDVVVHAFSPVGVTGLAILQESHLSVHTWPELGYAAADVFTCGERVHPERACTSLVRTLGAAQYSIRCIPREALPAPQLIPTAAAGHGG
ncbi:adenosylmethionine decarboxylase [Longimicrobium sp.]|uniref:adenosylmethionine decarboxylase n=1 Tax=Longimicrobium sp. TaxID=2029185 RepID=UPI002E340C47|nr:adenosylmethionine decarboxylase [Longimicrobium sp.]HEX6040934.1 adenosylmethionine decarboxylase [Longimicrobium sp.]